MRMSEKFVRLLESKLKEDKKEQEKEKSRRKTSKWTDEMKNRLAELSRQNLDDRKIAEIMSKEFPNCSFTAFSIQAMRKRLGLLKRPKAKQWTEEEEKVVAENYGKLTAKELAEMLDKSAVAVYHKVYRLRKRGLIK